MRVVDLDNLGHSIVVQWPTVWLPTRHIDIVSSALDIIDHRY